MARPEEAKDRVPLGALVHMHRTVINRLSNATATVDRLTSRKAELEAQIAAEREAVAADLAAADAAAKAEV